MALRVGAAVIDSLPDGAKWVLPHIFSMLGFMVSRRVLYSSAATSALVACGALVAVKRGRRQRPDLFPAYRPLHRMLEAGEPQQVAVIFNPTKERAEAALRVITAELGLAQWPRPLVFETTRQDPGKGMAAQAIAAGAEVVLAAGGDGTVRAVADGLAGTGVPLGVVPLGTGNLLARNLEMSVGDLQACVNLALHGQTQAIDMISMELQGTATPGPVNFVVMGGAGFDAQIMTDTNEDLKARFGWLAYVGVSARHMFTRRRAAVMRVDGGRPIRRKIRTVLVANTGKIQGGVNLASQTQLSDGQLEVIVLTPRTLLSWIRMSAQFILRKPNVRRPVVEHFVGSEVQVHFPNSRLPVEVDGDVLGEVTGLRARVRPASLLVKVYPPEMQINSLSDLIEAKDELVEQQRRWWQRFLRL